ncbi:HAD family hydrolase [Salipaludibacillus sp. HK11]|uniref:HAD family hydrolase n=1 Tax=Salipaludibacillus sp. HK11 TaxID=3394320 RepID=UPI0039FC3031
MINTIFFDLDDTLLWDEKSVQKAFEATCNYAATFHEIQPSDLEHAVRMHARELYASYDTYEFTKMIGINPFEGLWGNFNDAGDDFQKMKEIVPQYRRDAWTKGLQALGINDIELAAVLAERFPAERKKVPFLFDDALPILEKLSKDYSLLMLTNGSPELQNVKLTITPELEPYFDEIIISGAYGRGKPDVTIFDYALNKIDKKKEEVLMVGDNLMTDILGANRTGIKSVWLNRFEKERNDVTPDYEIKNLDELMELLK